MRFKILLLLILLTPSPLPAAGTPVQTPYTEPKVVFDFFLEDPRHINAALFWIRALMNPLLEDPYNYAPEFMDIVVVIHGTEIVTTVKHNYKKYRNAVERMRYYAELGVKFKLCGLAAQDYGYQNKDFQEFIELVPSAITELAHWQMKGYALIMPQVREKRFSIEEIR